MAKMTFRFTTECEVTIEGNTYEEIYLQFKDMMHGERNIATQGASVKIYPPETDTIYFEVEKQESFNEIDRFKGDFKKDIEDNWPKQLPLIIH